MAGRVRFGKRVRFTAGPHAGIEGIFTKDLPGGDMVVRCDGERGRNGQELTVGRSEQKAWGLVPVENPERGIVVEHCHSNEYVVRNLPRNDDIWLRVENFDVNIKRTDEGLVVDLYDPANEADRTPIASAYAFDADTMANLEEN